MLDAARRRSTPLDAARRRSMALDGARWWDQAGGYHACH
jgi:hypothetical protein